MKEWLSYQEPGFLISKLLTTIGRGKTSTNPTSYQRSTTTWLSDKIIEHLQRIRAVGFDAKTYDDKGYVLRGGIRTDGFRLHITAHKLKVLNCVLPDEALPSPLTSTLGGSDRYLKEVRNVIKSKSDVRDLWNCDPKNIKTLGLDLGQSCAAVYQPTLKFRRWLNDAKRSVAEGFDQSMEYLECREPELRGENANYLDYIEFLDSHEKQFQQFYSTTFKKKPVDSRRARDAEFAAITDQLLRLVGGSIGERRRDDNHVLIGVGKFTSQRGLFSLHGFFMSYFVNKMWLLGYIVLGPVDENGTLNWKQLSDPPTNDSSSSKTSNSSNARKRRRAAVSLDNRFFKKRVHNIDGD
ncbi:hypothetical protein BGZ65_012531 [Modicella reniformis]|uniref:Uncharacterized protein n=1 Tax=Modicella reniformis TaxID=1440133 RepID=A0A9P6IMZ1_9FUNG|nr:hypothetical protein BGZ65_012531 [Modicella reniformis]